MEEQGRHINLSDKGLGFFEDLRVKHGLFFQFGKGRLGLNLLIFIIIGLESCGSTSFRMLGQSILLRSMIIFVIIDLLSQLFDFELLARKLEVFARLEGAAVGLEAIEEAR